MIGLILRETGALLGVGLGAGVLIALVVGRAASSLLYGLQANDPLTFAAAAAALTIVAFGASYLPARRAAGVDPMTALRQD